MSTLIGWLLEKLQALRHSNGAPMVRLYGPGDRLSRGSNIAFNFFDPDGVPVDYRHTESLAYKSNISLRTGCFCNPGAGELAHNVTQAEMAQCFTGSEPVTFLQFFKLIQEVGGKSRQHHPYFVGHRLQLRRRLPLHAFC